MSRKQADLAKSMVAGKGGLGRILRIVGTLALGALTYASDNLRLTTENLPPLNIVSADLKQVSGVAADKVHEMMRRAGVHYTMVPSGWNRAYQLALTQDDTCVFATARIPERESMFKWVGPLAISNWQIFGRIGESPNARSLDDIRGDAISVYRSDALNTYLKAHGYHVLEAESNEDGLRALLVGRTNYWAQPQHSAPLLLNEVGATDRVQPLFIFRRTELYLACNRHVDDDTIAKLLEAQKRMEQDGSMQKIEARYGW